MRFWTHIAGAAVAAMVAMTAIPNDAAAVPVTSGSAFGFVPVGAVTFDGGATDIIAGATTKVYPAAVVNVGGSLSFAGAAPPGIPAGTPVTQGGATVTFDVPPGAISFIIEAAGWTFDFTGGTLDTLTPTGAATAGALVATYTGTITGVPGGSGFDTGQQVVLSQSCDQANTGAPVNCSNTLIVEPRPVPEPASMALLGTALAALGGFGLYRRRRNAA